MPTRKQRRRQAKAKRHEYEYVLVDESGNEVPVDPADLRGEKGKDRSKPKAGGKGKHGVARDRRGRPLREPRKPSWRRAIITGLVFVAVLLAVTSFVGSNQPSVASRLLLAVLYGGFGIPFFYWMDRANHRRWEKAAERAQAEKKR